MYHSLIKVHIPAVHKHKAMFLRQMQKTKTLFDQKIRSTTYFFALLFTVILQCKH
jgi:hypothetical protein